jgi:hypothetical protein
MISDGIFKTLGYWPYFQITDQDSEFFMQNLDEIAKIPKSNQSRNTSRSYKSDE